MSTLRRLLAPVPLRRQAWWLVWSLLSGWLVVYNIFRVNGDAPDQAALPSVPLGLILGAGIFAGYVLIFRSLARRDLVPSEASATPRSLSAEACRTWSPRLLAAMLALGTVCALVGAVLLVQWLQTEPETRSVTKIVMAVWDLLAAAWLFSEAPAVMAIGKEGSDAKLDAIDGIPLGGLVTAVLASVGIARDLLVPWQIALVVLGGLTAVVAHVAIARLLGRRGIVLAAVGSAAVAALALALPLIS